MNSIEGEGLPKVPGHEENILDVEEVYKNAIAEHKEIKNLPTEEVRGLIRDVILEIEQLEQVAERDFRELNLGDEIARRIDAVWVLSCPGTYDEPLKEDRYRDYPWAKGMDRTRLNYAARIVRKVAEVRGGGSFERGGLGSLKRRKESIKKSISETGPYIIYNGRPDENAVVRDVLTREGVIIPQEKSASY